MCCWIKFPSWRYKICSLWTTWSTADLTIRVISSFRYDKVNRNPRQTKILSVPTAKKSHGLKSGELNSQILRNALLCHYWNVAEEINIHRNFFFFCTQNHIYKPWICGNILAYKVKLQLQKQFKLIYFFPIRAIEIKREKVYFLCVWIFFIIFVLFFLFFVLQHSLSVLLELIFCAKKSNLTFWSFHTE